MNEGNTGITLIDAFEIFEGPEEQTFLYSGALATPYEWEADLLANLNFARYCTQIGRTFVKVENVVAHYNPARSNGYFYKDWYYTGPRICESDIIYKENKPNSVPPDYDVNLNPYTVWKYNEGCGCCVTSSNWTMEVRASITCK